MAQLPPTPGGIPASPDKSPVFAFTAALGLGFYLATFVFTIRWLLFADEGWRLRKVANRPMVFVTVFIFVLTMAYTALDLKSSMDQIRLLMTHPDDQYTSPMWMNICKCMFANSIALAADLVLIYRCYVVYAKKLWIIALPCFLWVGCVVCTGVQMYLQIAHLHNPFLGPYIWASVNMTVGPGIVLIPFWGSTSVLNMYCTTLLVRRIYWASVRSELSAAARQFRLIARSIAESGIIYMSISLAHFAVWFSFDNFAIQIISILNVPLIGIAFNLILIRAAHNRTEGFSEAAMGELTSIEFDGNPSHILDLRPEHKRFDSESQVMELP